MKLYDKTKDSRLVIFLAVLSALTLFVVIGSVYNVQFKKPVLQEITDKQEIAALEQKYDFTLKQGEKTEIVSKKAVRYHTGVRISAVSDLKDVMSLFGERDGKYKSYLSERLNEFDNKKERLRNLDGKYRTGIIIGNVQVCEDSDEYVVEIWD